LKYLVTGGAGFIGSHLAEALAADGHSVTVLDNLYRGRKSNLRSAGITFVKGDIRDQTTVKAAMRGAGAVYHLASQATVMSSVEDPDYTVSTNITGTYNVASAAARQGARLLLASSREVYGDALRLPVNEDHPLLPKNLYGASKVASEAVCRGLASARGLRWTAFRLSNVYGPRDFGRVIPRFIRNAQKGEDIVLYGGRQIIDFIWVGDAVKHMRAAERSDRSEGLAFNVGSGRASTLVELAAAILKETGSASRVRREPARPMEVRRFQAGMALARKVTGVRDRPVRLPEGIRRLVESGEY
jgi:nucleoside-diphosphate-sugar epimerase